MQILLSIRLTSLFMLCVQEETGRICVAATPAGTEAAVIAGQPRPAEQALREAERPGENELQVAITLIDSGNMDHNLGRYRQAEKAYRRAIRILEKDGKHPFELSKALDNLASVCKDFGQRRGQAEALRRRAIDLARIHFGPQHPVLGILLGNLATDLMDRQAWKEARLLYDQSLALLEQEPMNGQRVIAVVLANMGVLFGPFCLDTESRVLTRDGVVVRMAPRTLDVLAVLVTSNGRLLSKSELLRVVWGDVNVEEASLTFQISTLRKTLGEYGSAWIETVPKHGYRFTAPSNGGSSVQEAPEAVPSQRMNQARRRSFWALVSACFAVAGVVGWLALNRPGQPVIERRLNIAPLTSYPGMEVHPNLSPDGSQVAFSWDGESKKDPDIYVQLTGQGRPVQLTADPRPEFSASWSPDGRLIAFCRQTELSGEIVIASIRGGPERVIARPSPAWVPVCETRRQVLSWFPPSDALAVVGYATGGAPEALPNQNREHAAHAIYVVPVDGGEARPVTVPVPMTWGDALPSVSPDGRHLAFTRSTSQYWVSAEIHVVALTSEKTAARKPELLIPPSLPDRATAAHQAQISALGWLPGQDEVLFARQGLWTVPLAGSRIPKLIPTPGYRMEAFSVSRDGSRLAFSTGSWDLDIWRIPGPASNSAKRQESAGGKPFIATTKLDTNPQYSHDGKRIAFTSLRSGKLHIWVADADGSNAIQVTQSEAWNGTPRWSPDDRYIAYDAVVDGGKGDIYVIPVTGGPTRPITPEASHEDVPSWSQDGRWIYFESDRTGEFQLWKTEFPRGRAVQVTSRGGVAAFESSGGEWIYYGKRGQMGLWRKPVQDGEEEVVTGRGHAFFWGMYDKGACLMNPLSEEVTVECFVFGSHLFSLLTRFPNGGHVRSTGPSFAVSPDGKWILYTRIEREESDLMLVDNLNVMRRR